MDPQRKSLFGTTPSSGFGAVAQNSSIAQTSNVFGGGSFASAPLFGSKTSFESLSSSASSTPASSVSNFTFGSSQGVSTTTISSFAAKPLFSTSQNSSNDPTKKIESVFKMDNNKDSSSSFGGTKASQISTNAPTVFGGGFSSSQSSNVFYGSKPPSGIFGSVNASKSSASVFGNVPEKGASIFKVSSDTSLAGSPSGSKSTEIFSNLNKARQNIQPAGFIDLTADDVDNNSKGAPKSHFSGFTSNQNSLQAETKNPLIAQKQENEYKTGTVSSFSSSSKGSSLFQPKALFADKTEKVFTSPYAIQTTASNPTSSSIQGETNLFEQATVSKPSNLFGKTVDTDNSGQTSPSKGNYAISCNDCSVIIILL